MLHGGADVIDERKLGKAARKATRRSNRTMSNLYCRKHGERWWTDKTVYDDGGFSLISKAPLKVDGCLCDECNKPLKMGEHAFLQELMMHPELIQCSQAANYFDLEKIECRICCVPLPHSLTEVLFPPADTFEEQFEYVERIYRAVQDACEAQGSVAFGDGSVSSALSCVIDEDDPYRWLWRILGVDRKGKLSPQVG